MYVVGAKQQATLDIESRPLQTAGLKFMRALRLPVATEKGFPDPRPVHWLDAEPFWLTLTQGPLEGLPKEGRTLK